MIQSLAPVSSHAPDDAPIIVEIDGIGEVEFDAGTKPEVIQAKVRELTAPKAETAGKGFWDRGLDDLQSVRDLRKAGFGPSIDGVAGGGVGGGLVRAGVKAAPGLIEAVGRRWYSGLAKLKDATTERFPNVIDDLMDNRRVISQSSRRGAIQDMQRIGSDKGKLLAAADERAMVPRAALREGLDDTLDEAMRTSDTPVKDMKKLAGMEKDLLPDEMGVLPSRADKIKTKINAEADRGWRQTKTGTRVNDLSMRAKMNVSRRAKDSLEYIEPKLKDVNAAYGSAKGQSTALREILKRTDKHGPVRLSDMIGASVGGAGGAMGGIVGAAPGAIAGVALARAISNPTLGSAAAIGMRAMGRGGLDDATQRALLVALSQGSHE